MKSSSTIDTLVASVKDGVIVGAHWGMYCGPLEAKKLGLTDGARAHKIKAVARYGLRCALFTGIFCVANCELKRYRKKDEWVNICVAGGLAYAVAGAGFKNFFSGGASVTSIICAGMGLLRHKMNDPTRNDTDSRTYNKTQ